jgi:dTDP-4-amino-4,6-dideoxygalactose transaminase
MWVRKRIDIGLSDIAVGMARCLWFANQAEMRHRVERWWSDQADVLACLSVRTGFDLLLEALRLPRGSHLLMSSVNIGDMVRIIEHHGLVAVPVDLDGASMAPTAESVSKAITPQTKGIVVAHLFGGQIAMGPIVEVAKRHGLLVIEDCAQVFDGGRYRGHPDTDASMFSFGPIKTATALGGALLRVRDPVVRQHMIDRQETFPQQTRWMYCRRLFKYVGIKSLSTRPALALVTRLFRLMHLDYDRIAGNAARGFAGPGFFQRIRWQPSAPLLSVLARRLHRFDFERLTEQRSKAAILLDSLNGSVCCPGVASTPHTFWVFPIVVDNPEHVVRRLREAGFDASQRQSLSVVDAPNELAGLTTENARSIIERIVYLPLYPEMSRAAIERMADIVVREGRRAELQPREPLPVEEFSQR